MHFKARSVKKSLYNEWQLQCKNGNYNDFFCPASEQLPLVTRNNFCHALFVICKIIKVFKMFD